jgi:hypothetical protein
MVWVSADRHPVVERSDPMEELMASITARKKLSSLYARGVAVRFGEEGARFGDEKRGGGFPEEDVLLEDEVEIWIAPPNPYQREMAMREAQAARARSLLKVKNDENSEEYLTTKAYLAEMDIVTLVDYLVISSTEERTQAAVREVLAKKEWENIDELRDAMAQFDASDDKDSEEWKTLLERDFEYGQQVSAVEQRLNEEEHVSLSVLSRDELERRAMDKRSEIVGSQSFVYEYERQMKYYSVRDSNNHSILFYDSPKELVEESELIQLAIEEGLRRFITNGSEAKN